jgi:hypothetical protein
MTHQISLGERNVHWHHTGDVAWAVLPAGQLRDVGVELLYALYKWHTPIGGAIIKLAKIFFGLNDFFMHEWC